MVKEKHRSSPRYLTNPPEMPYDHFEDYQESIRYFGHSAYNPSRLTQDASREMSAEPRLNTLCVPEPCYGSLKNSILENRAFPMRVKDETGIAQAFAADLESLQTNTVARIDIGAPGEENIMVNIPTLRSHSDEPDYLGYNAGMRETVLASAYLFDTINYQTRDGLDRHSLSTTVFALRPRDAGWKAFHFADAFRATNGAFMFESGRAGAGPSFEMQKVMEHWQKKTDLKSYYNNYLRDAEDRNTPTRAAIVGSHRVRNLHELVGYREFPWMLRIPMRPVDPQNPDTGGWVEFRAPGGAPLVQFVQRLGQLTEDVLPTTHLIDIARSILSEVDTRGGAIARLAEAGNGADAARTTHTRAVGSILGVNDVATLNERRTAMADADFDADGSTTNQMFWYASVGTGGAGLPPRTQAELHPEAPAGGDVPVPPSLGAMILGTIADDSFDEYQPIAPLLEETSKTQAAAVGEIFEQLQRTSANHRNDSAQLRLAQSALRERLEAMGFKAGVSLDQPVPRISREALRGFKNFVLSDADQADASKKSGRPASFTKALSLNAPVRARPSGFAAPESGYGAGGDVPDSDAYFDFPLDLSRFRALRGEIGGLSADERWVLFTLMALRFDVPTIAHLANQGIQLFNASIERVGQRLGTYDMIALRRFEAMDMLATPLRTEATCRGLSGETDLVIKTGLGVRVSAPQYVRKLAAVFFGGVRGGFGTGLMRDFHEFATYIRGSSSREDGRGFLNDCFLNVYPITETERHFPNNILGGRVLTMRELETQQASILQHANSGHSVLRQMLSYGVEDEDIAAQMRHACDGAVQEAWDGAERPLQPVMERGANYLPSVDSHSYDRGISGTGPMGPLVMCDVRNCAGIYNGSPGGQFSSEAPRTAAVTG